MLTLLGFPVQQCMQFYFNMHGRDIGALRIYQKSQTEQVKIWERIGRQSANWEKARVTIEQNPLTPWVRYQSASQTGRQTASQTGRQTASQTVSKAESYNGLQSCETLCKISAHPRWNWHYSCKIRSTLNEPPPPVQFCQSLRQCVTVSCLANIVGGEVILRGGGVSLNS